MAGEFWTFDDDSVTDALRPAVEAIETVVEGEVYKAIKELLTIDNPDFLLWWFTVNPAISEDARLHLEVEGRGEFETIERDFTLTEMVEHELDGYECGDGAHAIDADDRLRLTFMQKAFARQAARIGEFLASAQAEEES